MAAEPLVSLLVLCHNQVAFTERCLEAVRRHTRGAAWEVIALDNASTDSTLAVLNAWKAHLPNLSVRHSAANLGFVGGNNHLAQAARGQFLVLLNNDTEVQPHWLEALLEVAQADPQVGVVGGKLVFPDGRLQEAGAVVFSDGTGWNFGRLDDPDDPEFNYRREVDYCSAAALLVRAELFRELGGFDDRYAPAYWEDADLCFRARERGYRVVYQPWARVVHHEGTTAGTDVQHGFKRFQPVNGRRFQTRWAATLLAQPPRPQPSTPARVWPLADRAARGSPQVLVLCDALPTLAPERLEEWLAWRRAGRHVSIGVQARLDPAVAQRLGDLGLMAVSLEGEVAAGRSASTAEALKARLLRRRYDAANLADPATRERWAAFIQTQSPHTQLHPPVVSAAAGKRRANPASPRERSPVMLEGVTFGEGFSYAGGRVRALGPTGALHIWREALAEPRTLALELGFTPAERFNGYPLKLSVRCGEQTLAETWYRAREVQQLRLALPAATTDLCVQFISQPTVPAGNRVPGVPGEAFQVHGCRWLPAGQAGPPQPARAPLAAPAAPRLAGPPPGATEVAVLAKQAAAFRAVLLAHKHALNPEPNFWYRYDTLAGLNSLDKLLTGPHRDLAALAAGRPIADIGAADGDLAFFLESVGLRCHVIDNAGTNHNGLRGARLMKAALGSAVDIYDLNLDQRFDWPTEPVGLALFLGLLYHLKNPYYALETLAQHAHYCVLSTKVAAYLPGGETLIRAAPVAYLLDELECNGDPTNFWIFSESGLERLAQRTGWEMLNLITVGSPRSDPASLTNDQRAFCLLRSQRRA